MVGMGKLGQACAEVMAEHYDVVGYDTRPVKSSVILKDTIDEAVSGRDLIFIAVPTPHDKDYDGKRPITDLPPKDFDYSIVKEVLIEINKHVNRDQLVVLISTVLPGTVRHHLADCITNARFIYNPYLIAMGSVKWDMVNPECLIIGTEDGSITGDANQLIEFYKPLMNNDPTVNVGTYDEAEAIKIFYNTFISAKISLVNMIQDVAEKNGNMNVDVVTDALKNATQRITGPKYLTAGMGDAGACVLPTFKVKFNNEMLTIEEVYSIMKNNEQTNLVESVNYSLTQLDEKKVFTATSREYSGKLLSIETETGKILKCTPDHLLPVLRNSKKMLVRASDLSETDKLFIKTG